MWEPVLLTACVGIVRLADNLMAHQFAMARLRIRGRVVHELVRAAGPDATVEDRQPDGSVLTVRAARAPKQARLQEGSSR